MAPARPAAPAVAIPAAPATVVGRHRHAPLRVAKPDVALPMAEAPALLVIRNGDKASTGICAIRAVPALDSGKAQTTSIAV